MKSQTCLDSKRTFTRANGRCERRAQAGADEIVDEHNMELWKERQPCHGHVIGRRQLFAPTTSRQLLSQAAPSTPQSQAPQYFPDSSNTARRTNTARHAPVAQAPLLLSSSSFKTHLTKNLFESEHIARKFYLGGRDCELPAQTSISGISSPLRGGEIHSAASAKEDSDPKLAARASVFADPRETTHSVTRAMRPANGNLRQNVNRYPLEAEDSNLPLRAARGSDDNESEVFIEAGVTEGVPW
ncbi:hypothetical protein FB451DRAFT_1176101 [Mycena latifolia]|nr:hypothetical protein FB451DRAFT_1176101 [Mycena latifolia]